MINGFYSVSFGYCTVDQAFLDPSEPYRGTHRYADFQIPAYPKHATLESLKTKLLHLQPQGVGVKFTSMRPELDSALKWACTLADVLYIVRDFDACSRLFKMGDLKTVVTTSVFNFDDLPEQLENLAIRNSGTYFHSFIAIF